MCVFSPVAWSWCVAGDDSRGVNLVGGRRRLHVGLRGWGAISRLELARRRRRRQPFFSPNLDGEAAAAAISVQCSVIAENSSHSLFPVARGIYLRRNIVACAKYEMERRWCRDDRTFFHFGASIDRADETRCVARQLPAIQGWKFI